MLIASLVIAERYAHVAHRRSEERRTITGPSRAKHFIFEFRLNSYVHHCTSNNQIQE